MISIRKLSLKNIGPFEETAIEFNNLQGEPNIHIFAGSNGTGKTSILHSLACAFDYFEPNHQEHTSNNIHKRFWNNYGKFTEDKKEMPNSFSHTILMDEHSKVIEKIMNYGCVNCGNIHQRFEKTISHSLAVGRNGKNYQPSPHSKDLMHYKSAIEAKNLNGKRFKFAAFGYSGYRFVESETIELKDRENFNPLHLALEFVKKKDGSEKEFKLSNWIISRYSKAALEEISGNRAFADRLRATTNKLVQCINDITDNEYTIYIETSPWNVGINYGEKKLEFDILPDGLRSILGWLGDLLMRLDAIPWENEEISVTDQNIFLFLDEIEVHLHPTWQYKILNTIHNLLPNAQVFISTHSPFIINSIDNAKIYILDVKNFKADIKEVIKSETGWSIAYVLENVLNARKRFGNETEIDLAKFNEIDIQIANGDFTNEPQIIELIDKLKGDGIEVFSMIAPKLIRLNSITGKNYIDGENN